MNNVLVIGAGASGMLAALTAAENAENRVTLIERQARAGRKLAATGNGRCNLSNMNASPEHYHGEDVSFMNPAMEAFTAESTLEYFKSLGLISSIQYGGRVYPLSDSANSVVDVLRFALEKAGVNLITGQQIRSTIKKGEGFAAFSDESEYRADKLIIACGGLAGGKLGGVKDGYDFLRSFGHSCTRLYPALVPVSTEGDFTRSLKGVRAEAEIKLNGRVSRGELQFTENGVSGPAVFDVSRTAVLDGGTMEIDFLAGDILPMLKKRRAEMPKLESQSLLTGMLHNRLGLVIVKRCRIKPSAPLESLSTAELEKVAHCCSCFTLTVKGTSGFDSAQITVGGIKTSEFSPETLESRLVKGLYACGEVLDIDGDCGGFNLQWAWASGRLAGQLKHD